MTSAEQTVGARIVVDLSEPGNYGVEVLGTKAANLARLATAGFRVPDGFAITTYACDRILRGSESPEDIWAEIRLHVDRLGHVPLAVRSSGTAEDLADASYAGQYETVLNVEGSKLWSMPSAAAWRQPPQNRCVPTRVQMPELRWRCWSSGWSPRRQQGSRSRPIP